MMNHKDYSYFQHRVQEKIADFERYEFGKQEGRRSKAEVLNILQELIRESNSREETDFFSQAILMENYSYSSWIYYLEEAKDEKTNLVCSSFRNLNHKKCLSDHVQNKILNEETVIRRRESHIAFFPIRGKKTIQQEINYPANVELFIAALEVHSDEQFDEKMIFFLEKYCRRLGMGIHLDSMVARIQMLNQHIIDMVAVASHDLRGPLNSIAVGLIVVEKELYGTMEPRVKEAIHQLSQKANNLLNTLEIYLGETSLFSGHLDIRKEPLDFRSDIINPLLAEFSEAFARNSIAIDESMGGIPQGKITIRADRIWLFSVYRNLFSNVVKYGGQGCTMAFGFEDWGDHYRFNVFNTGRPLDSSDQKKLFQKFGRIEDDGKKAVKGSGLGLYFAKEVIERHGGKIWYEPRPDGSNFVFTLPKV